MMPFLWLSSTELQDIKQIVADQKLTSDDILTDGEFWTFYVAFGAFYAGI